MKIWIYTDTSVLGGCEDEELADHSVRLIEGFVRGERVLVLSTLTVHELAAAPAEVRRRLASVPEAHIETLQLDAEASLPIVQPTSSSVRAIESKRSLGWMDRAVDFCRPLESDTSNWQLIRTIVPTVEERAGPDPEYPALPG